MPRDERLAEPSSDVARLTAESLFDCAVSDVEPIEEGVNALYRIELEGKTVVLKVPTIATDEEFLVEPALLTSISRETAVPVPEVIATEWPEEGPLETACYAMEFIDGRQIQTLLDLTPPSRERLVRVAGMHLGSIHDIRISQTYGRLLFADGELTVKTAFQTWGPLFEELIEEVTTGLLGEGLLNDSNPRFADLEPTIRKTLTNHPLADSSPPPAIVVGDYRSANLLLATEGDADQLVQSVIDVGGLVGDPLLEVAMTEEAMIDTPLGETATADSLRTTFRTAYAAERECEPGSLFDDRYPYYRLYAKAERLAAFDYISQYAPETDRDSIADRWRDFVANRVDEISEG